MTYSTFSQDQSSGLAWQWAKFEMAFQSNTDYKNPLYEVKTFDAEFISPSGKRRKVNGFWDGNKDWKIRFMPDETGAWQFKTHCSDQSNTGLHGQHGTFHCEANPNTLDIYQKGPVTRPNGKYYLSHADGTPFFWAACTAWNGTLKSTRKEWDMYLEHRAHHHYSVIQFVATQWRGCEMNSRLQTAYTGRRKIFINPSFFQHLDEKIDQINAYGLVAAPVLLWALPYGEGKKLSPGYDLPKQEATLLASYMVARYGAHHVIWILGGDGLFTSFYQHRWQDIGRKVFAENHSAPVAMHPMGKSWIGDAYASEDWLDIIGYQSGHHADKASTEFITCGPAARRWDQLPPRPIINMEPCYEEIHHKISSTEVRKAAYRSVFATPVAGISYGANGIWPWIREGEKIVNHGSLGDKKTSNWRKSLDLPGSLQVGYLAAFIRQFAWWRLKPDPSLIAEQPGEHLFDHFISLVRNDNYQLMLLYAAEVTHIKIHNPDQLTYRQKWFNPKENTYLSTQNVIHGPMMEIIPPLKTDLILILEKE